MNILRENKLPIIKFDSGAKSPMSKILVFLIIHLNEEEAKIRPNDMMSLANQAREELID